MTHAFDEATAVETITADGPAVIRAHTHPAYNNMVGPFGGITAATVIRAVQGLPEVLGDPLSLTINYAAPIAEGEWTLRPVPVRTNRTNQHWTFTLTQNDAVVATGTAVFGVRRDTWCSTEAEAPSMPAPEQVEPTVFPDFIAWSANYEMRFTRGGLDVGEKSDDSTSTLWLRDEPARPLDYAALTSMADTFYPRVFLRHGTYMPAGTISLTTYFHATPDELAAQGAEPVRATARGVRFGHGHYDQYGQIWGAGDVLLATTHQLVYYKDPQG